MFLANSREQTLAQHSIAVGKFSEKLFNHFFKKEKYDHVIDLLNLNGYPSFEYNNIKNIVFLSGLYHDIGKLDVNFQNYIKNINSNEDFLFDVQIEDKSFDIDDYPLHHEISFAFLSSISLFQILKPFNKNAILYSIYFHHANPMRKDKSLFDDSFKILSAEKFKLRSFVKNFNVYINELNNYLDTKDQLLSEIDEEDLDDLFERSKMSFIPYFQSSNFLKNKEGEKQEFLKNSLMFLIRSIIVSADRVVSSLSKEMLNDIVSEGDFDSLLCCLNEEDVCFSDDIIEMMNNYEETPRTLAQNAIASELCKNDVMVLRGAAGVGKTKIMLQWIKNINNKKRNVIIVPKLSIAESLFDELTNSYLPNTKIEILTGNMKIKHEKNKLIENEDLFNSDIVITTIDQIINLMLSHKKIDLFLETLSYNLIFDEFHEFIEQPAILMLFIQIINLKRIHRNSHTLLVSATPNLFLIKEKLNIPNKNIKKINSFNESIYHINLIDFKDDQNIDKIENEMFKPKKMGSICIFNTAKKAQLSAIKLSDKENNTLVYHSKFFEKDKKIIKKQIFKEFGKKNPTLMNVLRTGPILQASIDISTNEMHTEISSIDNIFQRMGRLVRWGEYNSGKYNIYIPEELDKLKHSVLFNLDNVCCLNSTLKFINYLKDNVELLKSINLNNFYDLYDQFFENRENMRSFELDFQNIKEKAKIIFENDFTPIKIIERKVKTNKKVSKNSIRGMGGYFCLINDLIISKEKETIIPIKNINDNIFTMNINEFYGYENLIKYAEESRDQMVKYSKNQHILSEIEKNIKQCNYQAKKKFNAFSPNLLINLSKNADFPLILSFTEKTKKIKEEDQFFNLILSNVKIGIVKRNIIK